jgi:ribonuclease VapC
MGITQMIIDTSVIIAILKREDNYSVYNEKIMAVSNDNKMSAASFLEAGIVCDKNVRLSQSNLLEDLIEGSDIDIVPFTAAQSRIARAAYAQYGKGSGHPAQLNFGDCFAYALAIDSGEALLFKGTDFSQTDVVAALP